MSKRKGNDINGIVLLNKPYGFSSNQALQKVRWLYNAKKAGHTGNLDPMATGLLPICFGVATKISQYLLDSDKAYDAIIQLGESTTTGDREGEIIQTLDVPSLTLDKIKHELTNFLGEVEQIPPMYSALKHEGRPLYEYAREGIVIERKKRVITILDINNVEYNSDSHQLKISVKCSKGTYIRTLAEDIAKSLGTVAHLIYLHRTQCGIFYGDNMYSIDDLTVSDTDTAMQDAILPIEEAFSDRPKLILDDNEFTVFRNQGKWRGLRVTQDNVYRLYFDDSFKGVAEFKGGKLINKQWF